MTTTQPVQQSEHPDIAGPVEQSFHDVISPIEDIIEDARNGKMFILVDHEDRENEGDLVIPAQMATPNAINFMATNGRGLLCLAMTAQRIDALAGGAPRAGAVARLWVRDSPLVDIASGPRVGVSGRAGTAEFPWRFWIAGDPTVSVFRAGPGAAPGVESALP